MTVFNMNIYSFCPLSCTPLVYNFPIQFAYRSKAAPFTSKACETNRSLVRTESSWKEVSENSSVALFAANMVPMCFGA